MTHSLHTGFPSAEGAQNPPQNQRRSHRRIVGAGSTERSPAFLPALRFVIYRGGVAAELLTRAFGRRRLATPLHTSDLPALNTALSAATAGFRWTPKALPEVRAALNDRRLFAQSRAGTRHREFNLSLDWLCDLYERQGGLCAVTGLPLDISPQVDEETKWRRPFRPSIDRIDSRRGYTADNIRIVCAAANYAMGAWGEGVFAIIAAAFLCNRRPDDAAG